MLISIIIPVYNAEKFLRKCLDSIRKQTYKNMCKQGYEILEESDIKWKGISLGG